MGDFIQSLEQSLHNGFIDRYQINKGNYPPKLLINNVLDNQNVLNTFTEELEKCESFIFSVAFITESGLATLKSYLWDLGEKGIKGRILTSTFLNFNQPKVFRELLKLDNVEVRLTNLKGFHSKGYIFKHNTHFSLIVGSSNLTASALKVNYEWNIKLTSHENGEFIYHFNNQFEHVWSKSEPLSEQWIKNYENDYVSVINGKIIDRLSEKPSGYTGNVIKEAYNIVPNKMQEAALMQIQELRDNQKQKGLIISATGTGKTYLSAFDVRRLQPKRMLFIVHREQILTKAKEDFKTILGGIEEDFGIFSGTNRKKDVKYLFATIQLMSKEENLNLFERDAFDYILIDEVHKAGADSYHRVMNYFSPKFMMGMTATPERTDGFNIYELFDYNIAYEIRLQEALEEDMLCPFHYYGVTEFEYNGALLDDTALLANLVTEERVNHIIKKINFYGYSGDKVRGLMFCSRKDEARKLSEAFNDKGLETIVLTGDDSQKEREQRVKQLEAGKLDYILTVDIFNEGIDIPSINQVVMLRQTQSSIIFIQQLGRGLRKHASKEFVTVIDFIGNYKNNYLIPVALSGDKSLNKDNTRRHTKNTNYIKGVSTVNFEEIARKQIFKSINNNSLSSLKIIREAYTELKNKIGRIPNLNDFVNYHSIDPIVIIERFPNYYQFLKKMGEDVPSLTKYENQVLFMFSIEVLNGKRKHEIILLNHLLHQDKLSQECFIDKLKQNNCCTEQSTLTSIQRIVNLTFYSKTDRKKYGENPIIIFENGYYRFNDQVSQCLKQNHYFKKHLSDICYVANEKSKSYISADTTLKLYEKYSRKDVCKLLNWENDESATIFGYKTKHGTCPIFITYHKKESIESGIAYEDELINQELLLWYTRNNRTLKSSELQPILNTNDENVDIHIFVKKDDDEGKDFYYLGKAMPDRDTVQQTTIRTESGEKPIVKMNMIMEKPIEYNMYNYISNN